MKKCETYCDACGKQIENFKGFNIKVKIKDNLNVEFGGSELCEDCKKLLDEKKDIMIVSKRPLAW